ncbi:MAG: LexA family protein [Fimbriimonadaceae bacterium]
MTTADLANRLKTWRNSQSLTQQELADKLGIKRSRLANFENGTSTPNKEILNNLEQLGFPKNHEVGPPLIPASQLLIPITYIGTIAASNPVNWTDPFESEDFEFVPPEMGDARGRFACKIESDSMFPLLEPHDVCVFQRTEVPKIGHIILFRSNDNRVTIKQLKHDGESYVLNPINPSYQPSPANGNMLGYLVGIVRERGTQRITIFDSTGILP